MNEKEVIHTLRQLKQINPREEFSRNSRGIILTTFQTTNTPFWKRFHLSFSLPHIITSSALTLLLIAGGALLLRATQNNNHLTGLNNEAIASEMVSSGDINISLTEITYRDETNHKINVALNELAQDIIQ